MNKIACIILFLATNLAAQTQDSKTPWLEMGGYVKDLQSVYFFGKIDSSTTATLLHNRLNFKFTLSPEISGRVELRNRVFYGEQVRQIPNFGTVIDQYSGLLDLSVLWLNENSFVAHTVIDRMLLQYTTGTWDITMGTQRINWGIANIWNPNDIFNAYNFLDFDYEERPGNDALRVQRYLGNDASVEVAWRPGKKPDEHIGAVRYRFNQWRYDIQFLAGVYHSDIVMGGGWAGNIKNAGFKGEFSYFYPYRKDTGIEAAFSLSLMADRTFMNDWYASVAMLFNSDPTNDFSGGGALYDTNLSARALFPFRYNFYTSVVKNMSPITSFNLSVIYAPEKNTLIVFPGFVWNVAANFDLDITTQSFFATEQNRYKNLVTAVYTRGRWSF